MRDGRGERGVVVLAVSRPETEQGVSAVHKSPP